MATQTATIVRLDEYRRRRSEQQRPADVCWMQPMVVWYPVWVPVAVWPMQEPSLSMRASLASG